MGRLKTHRERLMKRIESDDRTDEEKEAEEMFQEIRQVPGWTGDHEKDSLNPGIQNIIRKRHSVRQKKG